MSNTFVQRFTMLEQYCTILRNNLQHFYNKRTHVAMYYITFLHWFRNFKMLQQALQVFTIHNNDKTLENATNFTTPHNTLRNFYNTLQDSTTLFCKQDLNILQYFHKYFEHLQDRTIFVVKRNLWQQQSLTNNKVDTTFKNTLQHSTTLYSKFCMKRHTTHYITVHHSTKLYTIVQHVYKPTHNCTTLQTCTKLDKNLTILYETQQQCTNTLLKQTLHNC